MERTQARPNFQNMTITRQLYAIGTVKRLLWAEIVASPDGAYYSSAHCEAMAADRAQRFPDGPTEPHLGMPDMHDGPEV